MKCIKATVVLASTVIVFFGVRPSLGFWNSAYLHVLCIIYFEHPNSHLSYTGVTSDNYTFRF